METNRSRRTEPVGPSPEWPPCSVCGTVRVEGAQFCESCGADHRVSDAPAGPAAWSAEIALDRAQYERIAPEQVTFPPPRPVHAVALEGEVRIGRSRGAPADGPEIDLSGEHADPGVSRLHATIRCEGGGPLHLVDAGSTNGTTLNDDPAPIDPGTPVILADGDRIHVGVWTTITIRAGEPS